MDRSLAVAGDDEWLAAVPGDERVERAADVLVSKIDRLDTLALGIEEGVKRRLPIARREDPAALCERAGLRP